MIFQCKRTVHQVLFFRVDIGFLTYEATTSQCRRSVVHVLVVRKVKSCLQPAQTWNSNCPHLFRYRLCILHVCIGTEPPAKRYCQFGLMVCARGSPKCLDFTRNTPQLNNLCPRNTLQLNKLCPRRGSNL